MIVHQSMHAQSFTAVSVMHVVQYTLGMHVHVHRKYYMIEPSQASTEVYHRLRRCACKLRLSKQQQQQQQ
jgi:hypothetical protein